MVVAEQPGEAFAADQFAVPSHFLRIDDHAVEALVRARGVVVSQELVENAPNLAPID